MRRFCKLVLCCFTFSCGRLSGHWFQAVIVLYRGLFSNFVVLCFGILSLPLFAYLVFVWGTYWRYSSFRLSEFFRSMALCVKTVSCIVLRCLRLRNFNFFRDSVAESVLLLPVIDLAAKFWTFWRLRLSFLLHPPHTTYAGWLMHCIRLSLLSWK